MRQNHIENLNLTISSLLSALLDLKNAHQEALREIAYLKRKLRDQENKIRF